MAPVVMLATAAGVDLVQFHGDESPEDCLSHAKRRRLNNASNKEGGIEIQCADSLTGSFMCHAGLRLVGTSRAKLLVNSARAIAFSKPSDVRYSSSVTVEIVPDIELECDSQSAE